MTKTTAIFACLTISDELVQLTNPRTLNLSNDLIFKSDPVNVWLTPVFDGNDCYIDF